MQANHGGRSQLRIDGVPVGEAISDLRPDPDWARSLNSILMVVATDAPSLDYQLDRVARRAVHGLAKTGSTSSNSSGDFTVAFSTAKRIPRQLLRVCEGVSTSVAVAVSLGNRLERTEGGSPQSVRGVSEALLGEILGTVGGLR